MPSRDKLLLLDLAADHLAEDSAVAPAEVPECAVRGEEDEGEARREDHRGWMRYGAHSG